MSRRMLGVRIGYAVGLTVLVVALQSCADSGRAPTSPSPAAQYTPRALTWECMHQATGSSATGGWSFDAHAVDCGPAPAAVPDSGVGLVSAAPGNLRSTVTLTTVQLDWNPLAESVTSFLIEAGSASTLANLARLNTGNPATTLVVNSVPNGTYFVRVRAIGPDGIPGPPSNEIVVQVGAGSSPPGAPSGLTAQVAANQVTLSWAAGAGDPAGSYVVEAGSGPGLSNIVVFDTGSGATQLSATAPNGIYYVRIRGRNALGTGPPSNEIVVTTPGGGPQGGCTTLTVSPTTVSVPADGGSFEVRVTTDGCQWSTTSASTFISSSSGGAIVGSGVARFTAVANPGPGSRQGTVRVSWSGEPRDISVLQSAPGSQCVYSVSPLSAPLLAAGGPFEIAVTTAVGCAWTASPGTATFATLQSSASASGPGVARFSISPNGTASERRGVARVSWDGGGQDVSLLQTFTPTTTVQTPPVETAITVPPQPAVEQATVVTTPPPQALPNAGGCTNCRPTTGNTRIDNSSTGTVNFHVDTGNGVAFDELILALSGVSPVTAPGFEFAPDGSSSHYVVRLTSPRTSADVTLNVLATQSFSAQVAVAVNSQLPTNYVTTQPIAPPPISCAFTVNGPTAPLPSGAGTFDVSVTSSPSGCSWTASSQSPAFISASTASGTTPGTARFSIAANTGSAQRSGTVLVAGRTVTIMQSAPQPCLLSVTPTTVPVVFTGGQFSVTVSAGCSWTATSQQSFITVVSGGSGSGNGTLTFSVAQLNSATARSGSIRVASSSSSVDLVVNQSPASCFYSTSTSLNFSGGGTTFSVPITVTAQSPFTPTTCAAWTASSLSSFMTVNNPGPFSGSAQTSVNLAANTTNATRTGAIRISFGGSSFDITVTQAPAPNSTPRITSATCSNPPTGPGGTISCPGTAVDDNAGDVITWTPTASHTCTWFTVQPYTPSNPLSVTMRGTVPAGFSGTCTINFAVCDQRGACTSWTGSHTWIPGLEEHERADQLQDLPGESRRNMERQ